MSTLVIVDLKPKPSEYTSMMDFVGSIIHETRGFDGCQDINIYSENEGEGVIFVERWENQQKYEQYLAWRTESGVMDKLAAMLDAPPIIRFAVDANI
ncbi:MAG: hypothetical protein HOK53_14105 [Gammaproteobacteria bacterium]|jgi:quinol monooxygenase YgiN|nr:hypothetical protein [Gammaproteobacteria bacterium]